MTTLGKIPGSDHAGKQTVQLPHAQLVRGGLDLVHVPVDDGEPEVRVVIPESIRDQYSGHVIINVQSEVSIQVM